jgi:hypothetical protein
MVRRAIRLALLDPQGDMRFSSTTSPPSQTHSSGVRLVLGMRNNGRTSMRIRSLFIPVVATIAASISILSMAGTEGGSSTFFGANAGVVNTGGGGSGANVFVGYDAGDVNTSGSNNSFFGFKAGYSNTTGARNTFGGTVSGYGNTTANDNTYLGYGAGFVNALGTLNTIVGSYAGFLTTSSGNTLVGANAGYNTGDANDNTFLGTDAGYSNQTGIKNTAIGSSAGTAALGDNNIFIGHAAGLTETGSNRLYIDTCYTFYPCTSPLIYGEFDNFRLRLNGMTEVHFNGQAKSQLNFSLSSTDTGGFLTSVLDNNFFMSSGARYDGTAGGWIQRSSDQQAVIQGSGSLGYRIFTSSGHAAGTSFTPTTRLLIDYNGLFALNANSTVSGHEIHTSSGAYLTTAGVWTNASSREYKDNVHSLTAAAAEKTLEALDPVTFTYKNDGAHERVGFIAEEVPELVAMPDRKGLSPMDIVAVLTKVVQAQKQTIAAQKHSLESLEARFAGLQSELRRLAESVDAAHR